MLLGGFEVPLWAILIGSAAILAYLYSMRKFSHFKGTGIPGPRPWPVVGTSMDLFGKSFMTADQEMLNKYGKFVATFEGTLPILLVFDGEWLKEAFIKNFQSFIDRRRLSFGGTLDEGLFSIEGEHWKSVRKMLSPEFSSGKLKKMAPAILKCDNIFVKVLREANGEPVDIRRQTYMLTLDVIGQTAFGIDAEAQSKANNQFVENALRLVGAIEANQTLLQKVRGGLVLMMLFFAPKCLEGFAAKYLNLGILDSGSLQYFEQMCEKIIEARKKDTPSRDFLQTLADSVIEVSKSDPDAMVDDMGFLWSKKGLTKSEVIGNAIFFILAGFQTTADTMFLIFYELASNPDVQQKLYEEIIAVCDTEEITIEQINQLKYLDWCINETMRLYPQGIRFDRVAAKDMTIKDIKVPKGTVVSVSSWAVQRDPSIWENVEDFDPERFSPERFTEQCAAAFVPFGIGNRQCIGSRLALMEMKMTIISSLKAFKFEPNRRTPKRPLRFKPVLAVVPNETVYVSFVERVEE